MNYCPNALRVSLVVAMLLSSATAFAMVREVSFEELTEISETTVEVVVMNSYAEWNAEHTAVFTHYVVEPIRQVGGMPRGARFELLFAGGTATDGKQMIVTEVPTLDVGGQYILFLHPKDSRYAAPTVGLWQGAFRVVRDPDSDATLVVDANGRVVEKDAEGLLHRGRFVNVDNLGFVSDAIALEREPGMESDPIVRNPRGEIVPMVRSMELNSSHPGVRESVDSEALMNQVHDWREHNPRSPRVKE